MAEQDAIQTDAATTTEVEATPALNPRNAALEAIAEKHEAAVEDELRAAGLLDEPDQVAIQTETPAETPPETPPKTFKTKIDGVEQDVTEEELIRGYQKNSTASKRLEEAAARQKELDAREAELRRLEEQLKTQTQPAKAAEEPAPVDDDVAQQFLDAVYEGDSSKAKMLLGKLRLAGRDTATPAPVVDLDGIATAAAARAKEALTAEAAMDNFKKDFQDIVSEPRLAKVADGFFEEEIRNRPFAEALVEAGKRTREWLAEITPKTAEVPSNSRPSVQAKKETIDNLPSQSSVSGAANDEPDESPADVIRNMRKARGLPV